MRYPNASRARRWAGVAVLLLAVLMGCGRGSNRDQGSAAMPTAKADAVVVTYYYLPG